MVQAVSCQATTTATWVRSVTSSFEICGGKIGNGTGLSARTSVFPTHYHSTKFPHFFSNLSQMLYIRRNRQRP